MIIFTCFVPAISINDMLAGLNILNFIELNKSMKTYVQMIFALFVLASCGDGSPDRIRDGRDNGTIDPVTPADDPDVAKFLFSQAHHNRGLGNNDSIITYADEIKAIQNNTTLAHYNFIPEVSLDHEQADETILRPTTACGATGTIVQRIADCNSKNELLSTALAKAYGNGGEGNWKLVVKTISGNAGSEVWLDMRTQMIWSDNLDTANWCKASGNLENISNVDCMDQGQNESWCNDDQFNQDAKGLLGDLVGWRLPTREDFLQADINGIRHVVKNNNFSFWTATSDSQNLEHAWTYHMRLGTLESAARDHAKNIRCIGVAR